MQGYFGGEVFMSQVRLVATVLFFGSFLCCNGSSSAMNFEAHVVPAGVAIKATGAIRSGDAEKLQALIPAATVDEKGFRRINLESPGGEVAEALRVAEVIRNNNFMTVVTGECASACAMVLYPAGQYAMLLEGGRLGFHSCYDARTSIAHPECTELIAKFAASNSFPYGIAMAWSISLETQRPQQFRLCAQRLPGFF
jgi:membrane-bound ClpP family serine protease